MSVLVVVAHPDDEVLGCGGTVASLAARGQDVRSCILSGCAEARSARPNTVTLHDNIKSAHNTLKIKNEVLGDFPNIQFNTVPHLELVRFIESAIVSSEADLNARNESISSMNISEHSGKGSCKTKPNSLCRGLVYSL